MSFLDTRWYEKKAEDRSTAVPRTKTEYLRRRAELVEKIKALRTKVESDGREHLSKTERREFEDIDKAITNLDLDWHDQGKPIVGDKFPVDDGIGSLGGDGTDHLFVRTKGGREIRVVEPHESIRVALPHMGDPGDLSIGRCVRALVTGDWTNAQRELEATRTMGAGSDVLGGFLLPEPLSAQVIDAARAKARVLQAGARTIPMDSGTLTVAKVASEPTAYWRHENLDVTESDATFEQFVLRAKTVAALVRVSIELIEDASNLDGLLTEMLGSAVGLEIDRVCLRGKGAEAEPLGLANTTGIGTVAAGGTISYQDFSNAVQQVAAANGEAKAAIYHPQTAGDLDRLLDGNGQWLVPPDSFKGLKHLTTTQVPITLGAGEDETEAYVGDFSHLWLGVRTQARVEASREANDAFKKLQVLIRVYARVDVAVVRPAHFSVIQGITAA